MFQDGGKNIFGCLLAQDAVGVAVAREGLADVERGIVFLRQRRKRLLGANRQEASVFFSPCRKVMGRASRCNRERSTSSPAALSSRPARSMARR